MSCVIQSTKKYVKRPSPPFPANKCKNKTKKGNNGKFFKSTADIKGVYKWIALKSVNKTKKIKQIKKRKTINKVLKNKRIKKNLGNDWVVLDISDKESDDGVMMFGGKH
jgi:hypothetical protein